MKSYCSSSCSMFSGAMLSSQLSTRAVTGDLRTSLFLDALEQKCSTTTDDISVAWILKGGDCKEPRTKDGRPIPHPSSKTCAPAITSFCAKYLIQMDRAIDAGHTQCLQFIFLKSKTKNHSVSEQLSLTCDGGHERRLTHNQCFHLVQRFPS